MESDGVISSADEWEQGSLLPEATLALPLQWAHPEAQEGKSARAAVAERRRKDPKDETIVPCAGPSKAGSRMMVLTQTCDLVRATNPMPQVEVARVFTTTKPSLVAQSQDFGSARFFRVDGKRGPGEARILDYGYRALLDRGFLQAVKPDKSLLGALTLQNRLALARWLGQRYSRPAIPDVDYEQITRPIRSAWQELIETAPERVTAMNTEYAEWRYRREEDGSLTIFVLSQEPNPDPIVALEAADFLERALAHTYPGTVRVATDATSYSTFTKANELTTQMIYMEWASHEEGEDAAVPV
jgi:hypothetical protein